MSKWKYYFSPKRIWSFHIYLVRSYLKKVDQSGWTPEVHEIEQFMYRYLKCYDCLEAGYCLHSDCHCEQPERMHVRSDKCPTNKHGPMLDKKGWEKYKQNKNIQFKLFENFKDVRK